MVEITVPRLGWSMDEGTFAGWLIAPGSFVRAGDRVFELEGDKAAQEIESFDAGILSVPADAPQPGDTVRVGQVIGYLLAEGESPPDSIHNSSHIRSRASHMPDAPDAPQSPARPARVAGPAARRLARELGIDLQQVATPDPTGRVLREDLLRASARCGTAPATRRRARRRQAPSLTRGLVGGHGNCNSIGAVPGSGKQGRVRERDVDHYARSLRQDGAAPDAGVLPDRSAAPATPGVYQPASRLRRTIAQRMWQGVHQAAPVTLTTKVDAGSLVTLRDQAKRASGLVPSYNDLLIGLAARTLRELPQLNACWHEQGVWSFQEIHVATAVDTAAGLVAPVIRDADRLSLAELTAESRRLIAEAHAGTLSQQQLEGGTFTVTSLGMFGVDGFTPILNLPQAAILGVGRVIREPVVCGERIEIGQRVTLSLTFDHRVVDGAAARWLQRLGELMQIAGDIFAL